MQKLRSLLVRIEVKIESHEILGIVETSRAFAIFIRVHQEKNRWFKYVSFFFAKIVSRRVRVTYCNHEVHRLAFEYRREGRRSHGSIRQRLSIGIQ